MTKKELRKHFAVIRRTASSKDADLKITKQLLECPRITGADTVLMYASLGTEPSTWLLCDELIRLNIPVAYPKCGENGEMVFYRIDSPDQLHIGKYGIAEPSGSLMSIPDITKKTVCLVPAFAFTLNGDRIGHGGGYYDRFIERYPELYTIGITYEACVADELLTEKHDKKVRSLVTEERMVLCNE